MVLFNNKCGIYYEKYFGNNVTYYIITLASRFNLCYKGRNVIWYTLDKTDYEWKIPHKGDGEIIMMWAYGLSS